MLNQLHFFRSWMRHPKQRGNLKWAFNVYRWWKLKGLTAAFCRLLILVFPKWYRPYQFLGDAFAAKYRCLRRIRPFNIEELISTSNKLISFYRSAVVLQPKKEVLHHNLFRIYILLGKMDDALSSFRRYIQMKRNFAEMHELKKLNIRFFPVEQLGGIGLMGNLDAYIKSNMLGWRSAKQLILLLPRNKIVGNPHFLKYWCKYLTIISDPVAIKILSPLAKYLEETIEEDCEGQVLFGPSAVAKVQEQWDKEGRPPLLNITIDDLQRGWQCLRDLGVPQNAWFVCLHVREPGFKDGYSCIDSYRNADIASYLLAIKTITEAGGWVIRMGDPSMTPLPPMESVIDYVHSNIRSDWMDVFCVAQCCFFIGTSSGLSSVAIAFGVPCVHTNYLPMCGLFFSSKDIFIPKLCRHKINGHILSFKELLSPPLSAGVTQASYDLAYVEVLNNTEHEINDVVLEMLNRIKNNLKYTDQEEVFQKKFHQLTVECQTIYGLENFGINCRIGKDFLGKHRSLLEA